MRISQSIVVLIALLALCLPGWSRMALLPVVVEVTPTQTIKGAVAEEKLAIDTPEFIATPVALQELWAKWKITTLLPAIDFSKSIIAVGTTGGSILNLSLTQDNRGNMKSIGMATMDLVPGFRYVLQVVNREGVRTFNGVEVPTRWSIYPVAEFKGVVDNPVLHGNVPELITDAPTLQQLWDNWTVAGKMPTVDFVTQVVVVDFAEWVYSYKYYQNISGDIQVEPVITKGNGPGTRYVIAVLNRDGAVSVSGKILPGRRIPSATFTGRVKDLSLQKGTPTIITTPEQLAGLWQKWAIADKMPEVDFGTQLVIVSITNMYGPQYTLDAKGDLKVQFTLFLRNTSGFRYVISVISNAGVKSVDGVAVE